VGVAELTGLSELSWPEVEMSGRPVLAVPLGSTEQHGPHLPLGTDTVVAEELCRRLADLKPGILIAPALPYGSSGEHAGFAGTLSIGQQALETVVVELVRSSDRFAGVVLVSGHGGNAEPLARACRRLTGEGRRAMAWWPTVGDLGDPTDLHAGRLETSMMLALRPRQVKLAAATAGARVTMTEAASGLRSGGVRAVSANGVLGDPAGASAEEGGRILDVMAKDLVSRVRAWAGER